MMIPTVDIREELGEALSRASVLKGLDSSFGGGSMPPKSNRNSVSGHEAGGLKKGSVHLTPNKMGQKNNDVVVETILGMIGDNSNKTARFFMEQLKGKSIILENVKAQTSATQYMEKEKRRLKRQLKVSNRSLKKSGAISWGNMSQMSVASPDELFSISNMWKSYIRNLLKSCKSVAHYQARLMTAELVGAEIIVLDSKGSKSLIGKKGIVTNQSTNCLFIVCPDEKVVVKRGSEDNELTLKKRKRLDEDTEEVKKKELEPDRGISLNESNNTAGNGDQKDKPRGKLFRVVKDDSIIGVILPITIDKKKNSVQIDSDVGLINISLSGLKQTSNNYDNTASIVGSSSSSSNKNTATISQNICVIHGKRFLTLDESKK